MLSEFVILNTHETKLSIISRVRERKRLGESKESRELISLRKRQNIYILIQRTK